MQLEESFGKVLRAARKQRRLSQETLAADAGIERNYISLLECGSCSPTLRVVFKLCTTLDVPLSEMLARAEALMFSSQEKAQVKQRAR
jgi:transcriptional regulator with XRE-family HTH domain